MKEDIEKIISHYEVELIKEQNQDIQNQEKIMLIEEFIKQLKELIEEKETQQVSKNKKNKKSNKNKKNTNQEFMRNPIEPELISKKKKNAWYSGI